jgi:hypothetical protein
MGFAALERNAVKTLFGSLALLILAAITGRASQDSSDRRTTVIVVVGAAGEEEFGSNFVRQASLWEKACEQAGCRRITLGLGEVNQTNDFARLKQALESQPNEGPDELWLVLIGHGTFDGKEARFNLRGPDLSATELALWLQAFRRPLAIINTASSSAPFLNTLSATNRVVVTATRSGNEQNFARFGQYLCEAITNPQADLDKDGQVSLLEAFLMGSRQAGEFYKVEGRLATEHALLDDNGDGLGTPADWFVGLHAAKKPKDNALMDGFLARQFNLVRSPTEQSLAPEQRARRDSLERGIILHREKKGQLAEDDYYRELEKLLLELSQFYEPNSGVISVPSITK